MSMFKFREENIFQLPIDDLIRSNESTIQLLYKHFLDPEIDLLTQRPYDRLTYKSCLAIAPFLDLSIEEVSLAFIFSKKIQIDEIGRYKEQYDYMTMVEFYEFLVRLGDIKIKDKMPIADKTESIMDILFKIIGKKTFKMEFGIEVSSESDYNSDD